MGGDRCSHFYFILVHVAIRKQIFVLYIPSNDSAFKAKPSGFRQSINCNASLLQEFFVSILLSRVISTWISFHTLLLPSDGTLRFLVTRVRVIGCMIHTYQYYTGVLTFSPV